MLIVTIDRVERTIAVVEVDEGRFVNVPVKRFPATPREGEVYRVPFDDAGDPVWSLAARDRGEEARRKNDVGRRIDALRKRDPGGDVEL